MSRKKVLVITASVDNALAACGATLEAHKRAGHDVSILSFINHPTKPDFSELETLSMTEHQIETSPLLELVKPVESTKRRIMPDVVYVSYDSKIASAVITAFRPQPDDCRPTIYAFGASKPDTTFSESGDRFLLLRDVRIEQ